MQKNILLLFINFVLAVSIYKKENNTTFYILNNQIPKEVSLVVLMCAGWSCGAAKNYYNELASNGTDVSKIVDYAGGLHEWCVYNKLNPNFF